MHDLRTNIKNDLQAFNGLSLRQASLALLQTLGYQSDKTISIEDSKPQAFLDLLQQSNPNVSFDQEKALFGDWVSTDLLFQLTDAELAHETALFPDIEVNPGLLRSYLFFAIELDGKSATNGGYARGKLTAIARQINRVFPMPVMVFIKHPQAKETVLSITVINRLQNKRDSHKDVLGKVTIIRDISLVEPHRGHLEILDSFALDNLVHPDKLPITSFDTLHAAWEEIFNVALLNKRFYKELANWYFWALPQVEFPADLEPDDEKRRATGLIRLLTRLIFCWFLKEKGLIPEKLFHPTDLDGILKNFDSECEGSSAYYQAILQNLFFATLNQRMGKDSKGNTYRQFAKDEGFLKNRSTYDVNTLYRYEALFDDPDTALSHFEDIPFLNGGLFECLDRTEEETNKKRYIDGFSRNAKKRPTIPNHLFFTDKIKGVDLSDVYHDKKRKKESVSGILRILNRYKFTIVENTPIDQEIALDPELLGKVFENLLASYNEETKTTARKQTGSFYTPRPIVEYMVDESLKAYLVQALRNRASMSKADANIGLDILFAYTEKEHVFSESEIDHLLAAIHNCKILDPACGSGAFPMGVLHKLVYIIHKLDPHNAKWMQLQIDATASIPDSSAREVAIAAIERDFIDNEDDYGRKLYLIENCLYGVDIQPIAIQISKLRFFISLVCDQKTNRDKSKNHGIRPLPNLETKFVAADSLIGLKKDMQVVFTSPKIEKIEIELQRIRHDYFSVQTRQNKLALQTKDRDLRRKLLFELNQYTFADQITSRKLATWDPYDPHDSAAFFEPLWMFDRSLVDGFDIVIGNPPYGIKYSSNQKKTHNRAFPAASKISDSYTYFLLKGANLLSENGTLSFIVPNTFCDIEKGDEFRREMLSKVTILEIWQSGWVFSAAVVDTIVLRLKQTVPSRNHKIKIITDKGEDYRPQAMFSGMPLAKIDFRSPLRHLDIRADIRTRNVELASVFTVKAGVKLYEVGKGAPPQTRDVVDAKPFTSFDGERDGWTTLYRGGDIDRYNLTDRGERVKYGAWLAAPRSPFLFDEPKILMRRTDDRLRSSYEADGAIAVNSCHVLQLRSHTLDDEEEYLAHLSILNSSVCQWQFETDNPQMVGKTFSEIKVIYVERLSLPILSQSERSGLAIMTRLMLASQRWPEDMASTRIVAAAAFLEDLIDACVMECYFREHMADRNMLFLNDITSRLATYVPKASEAQQRDFLDDLYCTLNSPDSKIRNRLLRLTADSPDLLAIIKHGGLA